MTSIDWPKLINWIVEGLIGVIFGAISFYIAHSANKKWEQKKEKEKKELEAHNRWGMPNGLPPASVSEAIHQAKREGHDILAWQKVARIGIFFIVGASAITVLATMGMNWVIVRGLAMTISDGFSGFDLLSEGYPLLIITPIGAIICLLILIFSQTSPIKYENKRHSLAMFRIVFAIISAIPIIFIIYSIKSYDMGLILPELGQGIWLNLLALVVLGIEGLIDYSRPTQKAG